MRDIAWTRFAENMVGDSMTDQTTQMDEVDVGFLSQVRIANFFVDGDGFGDLKVIYCVKGEVVDGLQNN